MGCWIRLNRMLLLLVSCQNNNHTPGVLIQHVNDMADWHIQYFVIQQYLKKNICNKDGILRLCKIPPITKYNPNGLSDSSQSGCSVSHSTGNKGYHSQTTPSIKGNRHHNVSSANNVYTARSSSSVNYSACNNGHMSQPTPSVNGYTL